MHNYRIIKNGTEVYIVDSKDADYLSVSCVQSKSLPKSVFSSEAVRIQKDGRKLLVKWPDIDIELGDKVEIEITAEAGTLEPKIMYQTGSTKKSGREGKCSFCFKHSNDVKSLVFGPDGTNICDECIELSQKIITGKN